MKIKKSSIKYNDIEWYRSGWIFQQLIKLNCDKLIGEENILVLDSDTFIFSKQSFVLDNGLSIINFSDEYHFPYSVFKKLINLKKRFYLSFVCHHMIINKEYIKEMKKCILHSTNNEWIDAIIDNIDLSEPSCFSEYSLRENSLTLPQLTDKKIISPISSSALLSYSYDLVGIDTLNGEKFFKLFVMPLFKQEALFSGYIWIQDTTFALGKIDLNLADQVMPTLEKRVWATLERIARFNSVQVPDGVQLLVSQADLAQAAMASRQRVNQQLRRFQAQGLIRLGYRNIVLLRK